MATTTTSEATVKISTLRQGADAVPHVFIELTGAETDNLGNAIWEAGNACHDIIAVIVTYPCGTEEIWDVTWPVQKTEPTVSLG